MLYGTLKLIDATDVHEKMDELVEEDQVAEAHATDEDTSAPEPSTLSEIAERHLAKCNFSPDQKRIIWKVKEYLEAVVSAKANPSQIKPPKPFKILLTGGPGTGKSFVIETICDLVKWLRTGKVTTSSWNGIAAVNIDGSTLCSLLNIRPTDRKATNVQKGYIAPIGSIDLLQKMRNSLNPDQMCIFVIDEVSTADGICIATVDSCMKQIMGNDEDFGGLAMLFVGDFNQLPPVQAESLALTMMQVAAIENPQTPLSSRDKSFAAANIMDAESTDRSEFTSNPPTGDGNDIETSTASASRPLKRVCMRGCAFSDSKSRRDEKKKRRQRLMKKKISSFGRYGVDSTLRRGADLFSQCERIHLSTQHRAVDDHEHTAFIDRLSNGEQITMDDLKRYKKLSADDLSDTSSPWVFAPMLVASNKERIDICRRKSLLFAKHHSTYIFKWRTEIKVWKNKPTNADERKAILESNACFWETFVPQADAFLTYNVNNDLGLANGSPVSMYSITFSSEDQLLSVQSQIDSLPPGSEIILDSPPCSINVKVPETFDSKTRVSLKRKAQFAILKKHSLCPDAIVIPIKANPTYNKLHFFAIRGPTTLSRVQTRPTFPIDLAFAMTVHKAQGRTISRVVLALSEHNVDICKMTYPSIFVAMTRIKHRDYLRILYHDRGARPGLKGLQYITALKPNRNVLHYYAGFTDSNGVWDPLKALQARDDI